MHQVSETPPIETMAVARAVLRTMAPLVRKWNMWESGDTIALGLSGGKDSSTLLHLLLNAEKLGLPHCRVVVMHVGATGCPCVYQGTLVQKLLVDVNLKDARIIPPSDRKISGCDQCTRFRRRHIFETCKKEGIRIVTMAHHLDDLVQTYLMNLLFHGEDSGTMLPVRWYDDGKLKFVRPLLATPERRIIPLSRKLGCYSEIPETSDHETKRIVVRNFLAGLGRSREVAKTNLARLAMRSWPKADPVRFQRDHEKNPPGRNH